MADLKWDFDVGERKKCVMCDEKRTGVTMGIGYTSGDFVCKDCIGKYMREVRTKLRDKVGQHGELFEKIDKESERIQRIQDMAKADYVLDHDIFEKVAEIYGTIFPNGITSGSPEEVGAYNNRTVKIGGSGIGRVRSSWGQTARYGSTEKQVKIASKLWQRIAPLLSNYQDRTEKFKELFSTLEEAIEESDLEPHDSDRPHFRHRVDFNDTIEWNGLTDHSLVVRKNDHYKAKVVFAVDEFSALPLSIPDDDVGEWIELLPYFEEALEGAREKNKEREEQRNEIVSRVESAVSTWYTANSISI